MVIPLALMVPDHDLEVRGGGVQGKCSGQQCAGRVKVLWLGLLEFLAGVQ